MEREAEINAMMAEIRNFSSQKREKIGRAINNVNGKVLGRELGFNLVKYGRKNPIDTEINVGDLVLVSKGNPLKSNLTGTVAEKGNKFIVLALENVPNWALRDVRLDLYANDITFRRMEENLEKLTLPGEKALKFLLELETPSKTLETDFKKEDNRLNNSQSEAISKSLSTNDFFLIHGPFGTGKTSTLLELIRQEIQRGNKVLATAESNAAVDNLLEGLGKNLSDSEDQDVKEIDAVRLGHPQRVSRKNIEKTLAYQVENHPHYSKIDNIKKKIELMIQERGKNHKPLPSIRRGLSDTQILLNAVKKRGSRGISPNVMISMGKWIEINHKIDRLQEQIHDLENQIIKNILRKSQVILCTNSSAALNYLQEIKFQVVVVDEASQTTIPSLLIPLSKANRFIIAGDHKQLPPTIVSRKAKELEKTLFEELIKKYPEKSLMLNLQYRMNSVLMEFPNQEFYNSKIKAATEVSSIGLNDLVVDVIENPDHENPLSELISNAINQNKPLLYLDTCNMPQHFEMRVKGSTSIQNHVEAEIISIISGSLLKSGLENEQIGIISPYDDQVHLIQSLSPLEVHSVDGYQGREKEIILISMVRSNKSGQIGFLDDLRRFNVAISRARRMLIIIGDSRTLKNHPTYSRFIDYVQKNDFLVDMGKYWKNKGKSKG